ncbi:MAG: MFS transporter [Chloroflexota bacterium]
MVALVVAVFAVPAGMLASKIGLRKTFAIGAFLMAAGLATPWATSFPLFLATRLLFAIGTAMTFPLLGGISMQWFRRKEVPMVNGINVAANTMGNALAFSLSVPLAQAFSNWRIPLFIYASVAFLAAIAWLVWGKETHEPIDDDPAAPAQLPPITIGHALKQRTTLLLALSVTGPFALFMAISSWLPTYYFEVFHIPLDKASAMTALFTVFGIPAAILGGFLPMRVGLRRPFLIIPGLLMTFAGLGTFAINNPAVIYTSIALFGITNLIFMPVLLTIPIELPRMTPRTVAVVLAVALAVGNLSGAAGPLVVGYLADSTGSYIPGLVLFSVLAWSLLIGGLLLPETGHKRKQV